MKSLMLKTALALAVASPLMASAESQLVTGSGNASANLKLQVVVPRVLFFAVGTGANTSPFQSNTTVDTVSFDYTGNPLDVGNGISSLSDVSVRLFGNNGAVSLSTNTTSATNLTSSSGEVIPLSDIDVTVIGDVLPHPSFNGTSVSVTPTNNRVTDLNSTWRYSYANTAVVGAGTYTAEVTYTATMP